MKPYATLEELQWNSVASVYSRQITEQSSEHSSPLISIKYTLFLQVIICQDQSKLALKSSTHLVRFSQPHLLRLPWKFAQDCFNIFRVTDCSSTN